MEPKIYQTLEKYIKNQLVAYFEVDEVDTELLLDGMLDDCYDFSSVGGPFSCMSPSEVLKEVDPIAYNCALSEYIDSLSQEDEYEMVDGLLYLKEDIAEAYEDLKEEAKAFGDNFFKTTNMWHEEIEHGFTGNELYEFLEENDWSDYQ